MHAVLSPHGLTWIIAALATAGVITRPFDLPEAVWAESGAVLLAILHLLSPGDALSGSRRTRRLIAAVARFPP